ncbi:hypothetical protein [Actinokineospora sp. UTMC 2448]|uniref:hypothetical protein n=1 Tax=Actinokineospora sp. UTMC 2448 TaxID=2268449 RepID=UPI002164C417|nr:hypothetical protein [Actinokineospora sp. UTMC 2448]UVS82217.1 hypothetical protein Actkin_05985 [Actinokineospora sp. UTMC 2448]
MTVDEQDPAVVRLRRESGSVVVAPPRVDTVLRRVHERRREQRQHRIQAFAALSVVLIAVAGALLVNRDWGQDVVTPLAAAPIAEWPLRGSLAGDRDLLARAEETWRQNPHRPSGAVRAVFAGSPPYSGTANFAVVAMVSAEGSVAFVTTPAGRQIDMSTLLLRAVAPVEAGAPAIGFIAARPDPRDEVAGIAFGLAAPTLSAPNLVSSALDYSLGDGNHHVDGAFWAQVAQPVAAWNSRLDLGALGAVDPAAGTADPVSRVGLRRTDQGLVADGASEGDLIATRDGALGVVGPSGVLDTGLSALGEWGTAVVPYNNVVGTLTDDGEFRPDGIVYPDNRVVLVREDVTVTLGTVAPDGAAWRLVRAADPAAAPAAGWRVGLP